MTKNTAPTTPAVKTAPAKPANCACGCGAPTITSKALFVSGHDARLSGVLGRVAAERSLTKPEQAQYDALSDALRAKTDRVTATAKRKSAEKAARETAKIAAKKAYNDALAAATA